MKKNHKEILPHLVIILIVIAFTILSLFYIKDYYKIGDYILVATLFAVISYTIETYRLREIQNSSFQLTIKPVLKFEFDSKSNFCIKNISSNFVQDLRFTDLVVNENQFFNFLPKKSSLEPNEVVVIDIKKQTISGTTEFYNGEKFRKYLHPLSPYLTSDEISTQFGDEKFCNKIHFTYKNVLGTVYEGTGLFLGTKIEMIYE